MLLGYKREAKSRQLKILWPKVFLFTFFHLVAFQGLYYLLTLQIHWLTVIWTFLVFQLCVLGVTCGAHRLWSHHMFKATLPLRIFLCFCHTIAFQHDVYWWATNHRMHHKYVDTDGDPHNASRGFFYSHIGWLMVQKHDDVYKNWKNLDFSDLKNDPVLKFQSKYYLPLGLLCCFVFPSFVPVYYWSEDIIVALCFCGMLKFVIGLHFAWSINSFAHLYGNKPYDPNLSGVESTLFSHLTFGESWHNYHHVFPWDYKAAELDSYFGNVNLAFIQCMEKLGLAYDLKTVPEKLFVKRMMRTGSEDIKKRVSKMYS